MRSKLFHIGTFPWDLIVWGIVLGVRVLWGTRLWWYRGSLWTELKPDSWPAMSWYRRKIEGRPIEYPAPRAANRGKYVTWDGTTLGHGGWFGPGAATESSARLFYGEMLVGLFEIFGLQSLAAALIVGAIQWLMFTPEMAVLWGMTVWIIGSPITYFSCAISSYLRRKSRAMPEANPRHSSAQDALMEYLHKQWGVR